MMDNSYVNPAFHVGAVAEAKPTRKNAAPNAIQNFGLQEHVVALEEIAKKETVRGSLKESPYYHDYQQQQQQPANNREKSAFVGDFMNWSKKHEKETNENWMKMWNSRCLLILSYFIGILSFIIAFHVKILPDLPFPIIKNLEDWDVNFIPHIWWTEGAVLVEIMWGFSHIRKTVLIVLTSCYIEQPHKILQEPIQQTCTSPEMEKLIATAVVLFHLFFGIWLGWANNVFNGYLISDLQLVICGIIVYVIAELIIICGYLYFIYNKSPENDRFRRIRLASEVFVWLGFAFVSMTLPAVVIFMTRFALIFYFLYVSERASCC